MGATLALRPGPDLVSSSRNPAAPSLEESFSARLPLPVAITSFPFLFWAGGLTGGVGMRGGGCNSRQDNKLLSAWWEWHTQTGAQGTPAPSILLLYRRGDEGIVWSTICITTRDLIPRQLSLYITLLTSVTVGGFIFPRGLRDSRAGAPSLRDLKTTSDPSSMEKSSPGSPLFLGLQGLYLGYRCVPQVNHTYSHPGQLQRERSGPH